MTSCPVRACASGRHQENWNPPNLRTGGFHLGSGLFAPFVGESFHCFIGAGNEAVVEKHREFARPPCRMNVDKRKGSCARRYSERGATCDGTLTAHSASYAIGKYSGKLIRRLA